MNKTYDTDVLIVGAGPTGTTLAADLLRRDISVRIVDKAPHSFQGSRAKGIQPRTQEIFEDLGILNEIQNQSTLYPLMGIHLGPLTLPFKMQKKKKITSDVPYPNTLLIPQFRTDQILHTLIESHGCNIEYSTEVTDYNQDQEGISVTLATGEVVYCQYLVGADGGASKVRKLSNFQFVGETHEEDRMILIDGTIDNLSRKRWHVWPKVQGKQVAACPLPHSDQFQVMIRVQPNDEIDLDHQVLTQQLKSLIGKTIYDITWTSVFRPNVRLSEKYRNKRVFIAGDAAHVHTPAGAQGLNTGVQDAYNLGWKIGQVIHGTADDSLLNTYEAERQPIAARVLNKSNELYSEIENNSVTGLKRGDEERQLSISYYGGPLASKETPQTDTLKSGDRAPDAKFKTSGENKRLFELFKGTHFTLLSYGKHAITTSKAYDISEQILKHYEINNVENSSQGIADYSKNIIKNYGLTTDTIILIRPDGYIGSIITEHFEENLATTLKQFGIISK